MKYEIIKNYSEEKFRRITEVKRATFEKMVEILGKAYAEKHSRRGRYSKLSIEEQLLATLEYLREYRTYAHIAASYGIAESNIYHMNSDAEYEVILIDATETQVERPQKNKENSITEKRKSTL